MHIRVIEHNKLYDAFLNSLKNLADYTKDNF